MKVIPLLKEALIRSKVSEGDYDPNLKEIAGLPLNEQATMLMFYQQHGTLQRPTSTARAIRAFCKACVGGSISRVKACDVRHCALWDFRARGI
jgi:hypothetical protein